MTRAIADVSVEELRLAWLRTKADYANRRFVDHPHVIAWVELDLDGYLTRLADRITAGYLASAASRCWSPKAHGLLRPGSVLNVDDEVVYNFLLGRFLAGIRAQLLPHQEAPDAAYLLADRADDVQWMKSSYVAWRGFRHRSNELLENGAAHMLSSDITGFYDNIDIRTLSSDVREATGMTVEAEVLTGCLHSWAGPRRKGIPQGYSASDLLGKLYLSAVDAALSHQGFVHLRYVDDYRVFLDSRRDGRIAVAALVELLHNRGLNVQSAKTKILNQNEARACVDGIAPIVEGIVSTLMEEVAEAAGLEADYIPPWEINRMLESREGPPPEVLERAFREYFLDVDGDDFDKTLFHYLIARLGKAGSPIAADFCLQALRVLPEETSYCLEYFLRSGLADALLDTLVEYVGSQHCIYDHQKYQLIRWFYVNMFDHAGMMDQARALALDRNRPIWLRSYALAYVGRLGDNADLERLEAEYSGFGTEMERADVVAALQRMEVARRNALYGRAGGEGGLVARAVQCARGA